MIEVEVFRAYLVIEERREKLTRAIARQFPILDESERWDAAIEGKHQPEPICKVRGEVLCQPYRWMYLVPDEEAGLGWGAAIQPAEEMAQRIVEHGGWVDHPAEVPMVIL